MLFLHFFSLQFSIHNKNKSRKGFNFVVVPNCTTEKGHYNRHNFSNSRAKDQITIDSIVRCRKTCGRSPARAQTLPTGYDRRFLFPQVPPASARPRQMPLIIPTRYEKQIFVYCNLKHCILGVKRLHNNGSRERFKCCLSQSN